MFTGLRCAPLELEWEDAPSSASYRLTLLAPEGKAQFDRPSPVFDSLPNLCMEGGAPVDWTITPLTLSHREIGGRFWILDRERLSRLEAAQEVVARVDDTEMRAIAQALTASEFGLYDEAVSVLDSLTALMPMKGRVALAHRAFITVLAEMRDRMEPGVSETARKWVEAQLARHIQALMHDLPDGCRRAGVKFAPIPPATRTDAPCAIA